MKKQLFTALRLALFTVCAAGLFLCAALAADSVSGVVPKKTGYDVATIRCVFSDGSYQFAEFTENAGGYSYALTAEKNIVEVIPEYFSTTAWDGAVDLSWYTPGKTEYEIDTGAKLAGLAALVNGRTDSGTPDYRIKGDASLLISHRVDDFPLTGAAGGSVSATVYVGDAARDFSGATVYITQNLDMGGTANWTPIGGKYPMAPTAGDYVIEAFFNGTLDGRGHSITNLSCDRYTAKGYAYSMAIGLVGYLGDCYDGETAPSAPPTVRNLSVSGSVRGRRMVGGIVGRVGDVSCGVRIENCANSANVSSTDSKGVGGIVGAGFGTGAIVNCYNTGSISTTYDSPAGGIVGRNEGLDLYCCYNVGSIDTSGNKRGRAIGSHDSGSYTVSDCYYLEGCDDDPDSNGWYRGTALNISVACTPMTKAEMQSQSLTDKLNVNGSAFVPVSGGYPILFWQQAGFSFGSCSVETKPCDGGTVSADAAGRVPTGQVVCLGNQPDTGMAFRNYTANGTALTGPYCTVMEDTALSGVFSQVQAGALIVGDHPTCDLTITKTGTVFQNGTAVSVKDAPVSPGDPLYEGDVLQVAAVLREGVCPDDKNEIYLDSFRYVFTYTDAAGTSRTTDTGRFTVGSQISTASLRLEVSPYTAKKTWDQISDTTWYHSNQTAFTLTTPAQLAGLAALVKNGTDDFAGKTVTLGADLSLANADAMGGTRCWSGIGDTVDPFCGTFDGAGYRIIGMSAYSTGSYAGLFVHTQGAVIRNVLVQGSSEAAGSAAGIVAWAADSTMENCYSYVQVNSSGNFAGGISAQLTGTGNVIRGCYSYKPVTGADGVGGIVGIQNDAEGIIAYSENFADVICSGSGNYGAGGIAGSSMGTIDHCANYGGVKSGAWYTGGLVGVTGNAASTLTNSYNVGSVSSTYTRTTSGGIGGLVGYANYISASACYNYGQVSADGAAGIHTGAVFGRDGFRSTSSLSNLFYLDTTCAFASDNTAARAGTTAMKPEDFRSTGLCSAMGSGYAQSGGLYPELFSGLVPRRLQAYSPMKDDNSADDSVSIMTFTDTDVSAWFYGAVYSCFCQKLLNGTSAATFEPTGTVTRAMVAAIVYRLAGSPAAGAVSSFSDVPAGQWYSDAVCWAEAHNIVTGYGDDLFGPNDPVTREQLVTILLRYTNFIGTAQTSGTELSAYRDADQVSSWARDAMSWSVGLGLIQGVGSQELAPTASASRAELAMILYRYGILVK